MAFWLIVKKAIKIWFALRRLKRAKLNAYRQSRGLPPIKTCTQLIWHFIKSLFKCFFLNICCWFCLIKWKGWKYNLWDSFWISGTFPNELLKSLIGLCCGLSCTYVATWFLIYSLNLSPISALTISFTLGTIFSLGLAFTQSLRCFTMLALPPLIFSKQGRIALLSYILILALTGPGKNTAHNMEVLTESLVCSEEMANNATGGLIDLAKNPKSFFKKAFLAVIEEIKETSNHVIASLRRLVKLIIDIVEVIMSALDILKSVAEYCNEEATAYKQCLTSLDTAIKDCQETLPSALTDLCNIVKGVKELCPVAKLDRIILCWLPEQIIAGIKIMIDPIISFFKDFLKNVKIFFIVGINVTYSLDHKMTPTKSFKQIVHEIKLEVQSEFKWLLDYIDWMDLLVSCFFLYGFVKAIIYRHRFLSSDRYDNSYITKGMVQFDWERKLRGREYIFPLKYRESELYVDNYSLRLLEHEKKVLKYSLAIVAISSAKILSYVFLDLLLFLFLELLRKYGAIQIETEDQLNFSAKILGSGFLADMYRRILDAMTPVGESLPAFDTTPCLPIAKEPDYLRYAFILFLLLIVFIGTYAEPYGMRSRHIICEFYYPERKIPRDRWLYFHILSSRGNFFTFAKNQLLAMVTKDKVTYRFSLMDRLSSTIPCCHNFVKWMGWEKKSCVLCGKEGDKDDFENFYHCPNCHSVFCKECYEELKKQCPLCSTTIDFDNIDEERKSDEYGPEPSGELAKSRDQRFKKTLSGKKKISHHKSSAEYERLDSFSSESGDDDEDEDMSSSPSSPMQSLASNQVSTSSSSEDLIELKTPPASLKSTTELPYYSSSYMMESEQSEPVSTVTQYDSDTNTLVEFEDASEMKDKNYLIRQRFDSSALTSDSNTLKDSYTETKETAELSLSSSSTETDYSEVPSKYSSKSFSFSENESNIDSNAKQNSKHLHLKLQPKLLQDSKTSTRGSLASSSQMEEISSSSSSEMLSESESSQIPSSEESTTKPSSHSKINRFQSLTRNRNPRAVSISTEAKLRHPGPLAIPQPQNANKIPENLSLSSSSTSSHPENDSIKTKISKLDQFYSDVPFPSNCTDSELEIDEELSNNSSSSSSSTSHPEDESINTKIRKLDQFYSGMPFPPSSNI